MKLTHLAIAALILSAANAVSAQQPGASAPDPVAANIFPPELVMQHQQEIGLTDEQRTYIIAEIGNAQQKATDLQWKLQREMEALGTVLKADPVNEQSVLAQLDRVLASEREIKRAQLTLVTRIKNKLTPEQRAKLREIRADGH